MSGFHGEPRFSWPEELQRDPDPPPSGPYLAIVLVILAFGAIAWWLSPSL